MDTPKNPFPFHVRASDCPLASMHNVPCRTLDEARHVARWMAGFIHRVVAKPHVIAIISDDGEVESASSDDWRQETAQV